MSTAIVSNSTHPTARPPAAAVVLCPGEALRRHGGKPRKPRPRYANGHRKPDTLRVDRGHDTTHTHRAELVGAANTDDPKAGYPLGVLQLLGLLADPDLPPGSDAALEQSAARLKAGLDFAVDHHVVWGRTTTKSHLATIISGIRGTPGTLGDSQFGLDAATWLGIKTAAGRRCSPHAGNPFPYHVLQRLALDQEFWTLNEAKLIAARLALQTLVDLQRRRRPAAAQHETSAAESPYRPSPAARQQRGNGYQPLFSRELEGPKASDPALVAAIAKLKAGRTDGSAD
jgi:hypothetical protein